MFELDFNIKEENNYSTRIKTFIKWKSNHKAFTYKDFPKAIHFAYDKECLLYLILNIEKSKNENDLFGKKYTIYISQFYSLPQQQYMNMSESEKKDDKEIKIFVDLFRNGGHSLLCKNVKVGNLQKYKNSYPLIWINKCNIYTIV